MFTWVPTFIELAQACGIGAIAVYLLAIHIPKIERRHREERHEWLEYIQRRDSTFEEMARNNLSAYGEIQAELKTLEAKIDEVQRNRT